LLLAIILLAASAAYGLGVISRLTSGGFQDASSASTKVVNATTSQFADKQVQLVALFSNQHQTVSDADFMRAVVDRVSAIRRHDHVVRALDFYSTGAASMVSHDRHQTYVAITLAGDSSQQQAVYDDLMALPQPNGVQVRYGGEVAINAQISGQIKQDLAHAEILSFPILAILLIIVFRSVVAALLPLLIGGMSILGAFLIVRLVTNYTSVSVYAINVITLMGLGLAIDYSLFVVSRFREEISTGKSVPEALETTLLTAGRTILFSGCTVILSLLGLLVFPQTFLRSMGLGGAAAVAAAVILALTVLPATLRLLGRRVNALSLPYIASSLHQSQPEAGIWYRFSKLVMRWPVVTLMLALAVLVSLGLPFLHVRLTTADVSIVPQSYSSKQVSDELNANFGNGNNEPIVVLLHAVSDPTSLRNHAKTKSYLAQLARVPGITGVAPTADVSGSDELVDLYQQNAPQSGAAKTVVEQLRQVAPASGLQAQIGGQSAQLVDLLDSLQRHLPYALGIIAVTTSLLLFFMLGSLVIPIKAVILNVLSLGAAFGTMVWIFQDGHLASTLGLTAGGSIDATQPILIFAIAFGLAMDYELFLLSRIKESYDQTHDNVAAIATGIQKTASIITSAALLLVVVIGLFATGKISLIQQVGVGLGVAVAIDATVVRIILLPAAMRLLGRYNWWPAQPPTKKLSKRS
jgi:RND superfamily putative drug exporter